MENVPFVFSFQFGAVIELSSDNDVETFVNENYPPFVVPFEFNVLGLFKLKDSKGKANSTVTVLLIKLVVQ